MKNREILISQLLFFVFTGSIGSFSSFINLHLEQIVGLTGSQIGFVTFLGLIITVIMNPIWGYIADKTGKHVLLLKMAFLSAAVIGTLYYGSRSFLLVTIVVIVFEALRAPIMPMLEYITINYSEKYHYDFGKVRVFASWGFLIVAMAAGFMVAGLEFELFGNSVGFDGFISLGFAAFGIFIIMNVIALGLMFLLPKADGKVGKTVENEKSFGRNDIKELFTNRRFVFILILSMVGFNTVDAALSYSTMHLVTVLEAAENIVSWVVLFMVTPELILVPSGILLMMKFGFKNWYILAMVTMIFRLGMYSFVTNPLIFAVGGIVHSLMVVMHFIGTIIYIRKVVLPTALGLAFTLLASSMALSRAVLSFMFGWIYENVNSFAVFRIGALIVLVALVLAVKSTHLKEVGDEIGENL